MTTPRKTDEQFTSEIDALDKGQRYARAMMLAHREAMRARDAESALARLLAAEVAAPDNPGHIGSCHARGGASASCSAKCLEIAALLTAAGTGL